MSSSSIIITTVAKAQKRSKKDIEKDPKLQYLKRPYFWRIMDTETGEFLKVALGTGFSQWSRMGKIITSHTALMHAVECLKKSKQPERYVVVPYEVNQEAILPVRGYGE